MIIAIAIEHGYENSDFFKLKMVIFNSDVGLPDGKTNEDLVNSMLYLTKFEVMTPKGKTMSHGNVETWFPGFKDT